MAVVSARTRLLVLRAPVLLHVLWFVLDVQGEILTPPYFNLAEGKNITATATCGVDTEGPELFCKLIGANSDNDLNANVIQGQYCDVCDPTKPDKMHPPEFAVDGTSNWWQSPPLSRGMKYNEVNLTVDLGQEFHVAYVYIRMGISPRPGLWVLEKSVDYGKTYTPWQYFSDSSADCETFFGTDSRHSITRDDSVICTTDFSKIVPLEGGEIPISLMNNRPSASHYFNSTILQEWTRATNVRLRFLRTKNLLGHLMSVARQDPSVTRRYFYSIKDISIGGRCMCNGHADACDIPDTRDNRVLLCRCKHNTCGAKCNSCCPGFEQKAWRQSKHNDPFRCESCNCFQHSNECVYDKEVDRKHLSLDINGKFEGGGVCQNCQHNTEGINCNKCKPKFYRPYPKAWNETDVCQPCDCNVFYSTGNCAEGSGHCECRKEFNPPNCNSCSFGYYDYPDCKPCECFLNGTQNLQCSLTDGACICKSNFGGQFCKECASGFYKFPNCIDCECDAVGSDSTSCDQESGNCTCNSNFAGQKCSICQDGYYAYPECKFCDCDIRGTKDGICDKKNGQCICKEGYGGPRCDTCILGYYDHPDCKPCNCSKDGSRGTSCSANGKCSCLTNFAGRTCNQCSPGYFSYPECKPCDCDYHGSNGVSCGQEGRCECHENFDGQRCDICKEGFYNFPACEECKCDPNGIVDGFAGCGSVPAGELCQCKEHVEGRICDKCKPLYWNLHSKNSAGCEECDCNKSGVLGGISVCEMESGQCVCKPSVQARGCSECADRTYDLKGDDLFGCKDCGCDVGGAISNVCNKTTGQCTCESRVTGRTCKEPLVAHYFPTLYQYQYEVEVGRTPEHNQVRYAHDERVFPDFSWKGYAVFSQLQKEILINITISESSLYRMVLRFVNNNANTVIGGVRLMPDSNPGDIEQYIKVQFRNSSEPAFVTVSGEAGNTLKPFVLNPGRWTVSINVNESVFIDYFVLLPEDFYLASVLNQKVETPCKIGENVLCRHYAYPNVTLFDKAWGVGGFIQTEGKTNQLNEFFYDTKHLHQINVYNKVPLLSEAQQEITFNLSIHKPGPYVIVVNYVTPLDDLETYDVKVSAGKGNRFENGSLMLYSCPYSWSCRQVVIDEHGVVAVYNVDGNYILIKLRNDSANVGIHSIYAVPYQAWSLDYIEPKPVCIRKDGECISSTFRNIPESKKIQFEQEVEGELGKNRPPIREHNKSSYIWLNPTETSIDLKGKVPSPGFYTFIVHYYQPDYPDFNLEVIIQNGEFYEAKVPISHCPSEYGCRSVVTQANRNKEFSLTENFMITLKQPDNKNVFLDYLLVVPSDLYHERSLEEEELDRTGQFISSCGNNHFNVDTSQEGFCKDSVFSITAGHNRGALPCQCDYSGSISFECNRYGGQCQCKENVIGRRCEACKTGFYGFPECKPCNCPSTAYCEPATGQCICPPRVTGERCDQCEPLTYGYDTIIGCEECNCNYLGVNGSEQCDLTTGNCLCKENIVSRTCDTCKAGHYSFPYCESCGCDNRGTTPDICHKETAECFCKKFVVGPLCENCQEGSFNLQANNEEGCTECFCFGKTTRCDSSSLVRVVLSHMDGWNLTTIDTSNSLNVSRVNLTLVKEELEISVDSTDFDLTKKVLYFSAPQMYLGKKLTSYGGFLNFTLFYSSGEGGSAVIGADVILQGADTYLTYYNYEQPPADTSFNTYLQLVESNFELPNGGQTKRDHIMTVLKDLRGIYIRATYWTDTSKMTLHDVTLDEARTPTEYDYPLVQAAYAVSVEQCRCPPNYQGLSCEECAPGYYRIQTGPHGGYCTRCQCNEHANECDVDTGVCLNCMDNTRGDHCELCNVGYHGNALAGTPNDCLICACPLPLSSNNFANSCDLSSDGEKISCECREGYIGARCHSCAPGYFGRPEVQGDYCKPCQCSGNINPNDPSSCDTVTGQCLRCLNNTFGEACSLCAPGYFGDAVNLKDCQACICDELGTERCDSFTGTCVCKTNVVGEKCDRCEERHYGFQSGAGCIPCDCGEASDSDQCDDITGQCKCKEGVTGRSCDRCAGGFWNYTTEGCASCGCKSEYSNGFGCNAQTGQCECLRGVIGEKCDQCPHRWAFVQDIGCHECDSCHHALLDDTDKLVTLIDPIIFEFDSTQSGYFTRRRLENMHEQLEKLKPKFDDIDPKQYSLGETIQELESLEQDSKNLNRKSNYSLENSETLNNQSTKLKDNLEILLDEIFQTDDEVTKKIDDIRKISGDLNEEASFEIELPLKEGEALLEDIKKHDLSDRKGNATNQLKKVNDLLEIVNNYRMPVDDLQNQVNVIEDALKDLNNKLDDLYNHTQFSINMANEAEATISKSGKDRLKSKLKNIENQISQSKGHLRDSEGILANTSDLLDISFGKLKELQDAPSDLEGVNQNFKDALENNRNEINTAQELKPQVQEHAANLSERVQQLEHILSESQFGSKDAVKAARAYKDIVAAVRSAREAAESAQNDTNDAVAILDNVEERSNDAETKSAQALDDAHKSKDSTFDRLQPKLTAALEKYAPVKEEHDNNVKILNDVLRNLENVQVKNLSDSLKQAADNAEGAFVSINSVEDTLNNSFNELPKQKEQAQALPKEVDDMKRNIIQAEKQIHTVKEKLPPVEETLRTLPEILAQNKKISDNIEANIKKLSQQIELARDVANRIEVGVKFFQNTTLELRNPENLEHLTTSTKFSGYFKTKETNGLLLYIGNPNGTNLPKTKTDDFMALFIQNGYPVLKLDVGNGLEQVINPKYVSDNNWYQFVVERVGHNAKLTILEDKDKVHVAEKQLSFPYTIFNLDKVKSKIFVGSIPPEYETKVQKEINVDYFEGEMEHLVIGNTPVSLWNFKDGYENNHGAVERDKLVNLIPSTGYRFNGNGYAILDARSLPFRTRSSIQLQFKTFANTGLLFLAGKEKTFISLELRNGKVIYQYNLGDGTKQWVTSNQYNDGNWHNIRAIRNGAEGRFTVDQEQVIDRTKAIKGQALELIDTMSFGGYPRKHNYSDVTEVKLDGCINNVTIMNEPIDLRKNIKAYDITPGCPPKFAPMVSFAKNKPGYIGWDRLFVNNDFKVSLKFKAKEKDGLIFYVTNTEQDSGISLALRNGRLVVISQNLELISRDTFNDSQWHVVSVVHNDQILRIDSDDYAHKVTDNPPPRLDILYAHMYVGGLPSRIKVKPGKVASSAPFSGCIADLTVNGTVMNFANTTNKSKEILDKCILDVKVLDIDHQVPDLKPILPLDSFTTESQDSFTENPNQNSGIIRGDGGKDFLPVTESPSPQRPEPNEPVTEIVQKVKAPIGGPVGTVPTTTTTKAPPVGCALPIDPIREDGAIIGYRFGTQGESRLEYNIPRGRYKKSFDFRFEFKTEEPEGILFYVWNRKLNHYAAVYLINGYVVAALKSNHDPLIIKTNKAYNDGDWHFVEFSRESLSVKLVVDGNDVKGDLLEKYGALDLDIPFYLGGVPSDSYNQVQQNLNATAHFKGCIKLFSMNSKPMDKMKSFGVVPCSNNVEIGTFFGGGSHTYLKLREKYKVGKMFNIKMNIKPRVDSGVLVTAHGKKDYYVLELHNGQLRLTVENGKGPVTAVFHPTNNRYHLCDGNWHSIQAVKSKNVVTLSVDNSFTEPKIGSAHSTSTDTGSALFLGGHRMLKRVRGIASRTPYIGCIKDVTINDEPTPLLPGMAEGNVTFGACQTN